MMLDILAFGAHPDDVELGCSGTLAGMVTRGAQVGIIDLTRGELGTRGTPEVRLQESETAAAILGAAVRINLGMRDGFFQNNEEHQLMIIQALRKYRPQVVLCNAPTDRHVDHGRGSALVRDAGFLSGLRKIETRDPETGEIQQPWRPQEVFCYIQDQFISPDFVIDITATWPKKLASVQAYRSQFYNPGSDEPVTYIATDDYWKFIEARNREMGHLGGYAFGEGFVRTRTLAFDSLTPFLSPELQQRIR